MKYQIILIFSLSLLLREVQLVSKSKEKVDEYCSKDSLEKINRGEDDLEDIREDRDNEFYNNYRDIVDYLKDPDDNSEQLFDTFTVASIFILILMLVILISFIVFVCLCLGKYKERTNVKGYAIGATFVFILIVFLFVWLCVFLGLASSKVDEVICSIFKLPSGIIDGY